VVPDGKHAVTHYEVETNYPSSRAALVTVRLETGRTHQIRVHFAAIDHPLIGDHTYRKRPTTAASPRVFLHASSLRFVDPSSGAEVEARSPLPDDLASALERLGEGIPA
jgi:23S rRNA pseudouridine1911/1915/1917 synthase